MRPVVRWAIAAVLLFAVVLMACAGAGAQPSAPPTLTDVEKLTVLTAVQRLEIAQLRAKDAERELRGLLKSLEKPGYLFNLQTLAYQKAPATTSK